MPQQRVLASLAQERDDESVLGRAMQHSNKLGAGAKAREHLSGKNKFHAVLKEYKRGTLHSGSGGIVKNKKQALAIAFSEQRKHK